MNKLLTIYCPTQNSEGEAIQLTESCIQAGFPSPAEGYLTDSLNLHDLVVKNPPATFFVRVVGDSMKDAGIASGDILVVDRSLEPRSGKIVVAILDGEFTVKKIHLDPSGAITLMAANPAYAPIKITRGSEFQVWGVVSYVIHKT
jgi:DNA polymerase V